MEQIPEGTVTPVRAPGERLDCSFREGLKLVFGVTDEDFEAAAVRVREKYKLIDRATRDAAINSRNIIIGRTTLS